MAFKSFTKNFILDVWQGSEYTSLRYHRERLWKLNPFSVNPHKMVKHTQTIGQQQLTNCLGVFDHFVGLALKGLRMPPLLFNKFINYLSFLISKTQLIIHTSIRCATVNTIYYTVHLKTIYTCNFSPFVSVGDYSKTLKTLLIRDKLNFGPSFNTFGVSFTRTLLKRKIMEPNK